MSKDIKFRIWNKMDRKFYTYNKLDTTKWLIDMDGNLGYMDLTDFSWGGLIPKGFYQINQYTGLKDKNGKEIYEGDICKYVCGKSEWIAEVVFHYGMFTFPIKEKPLGRYVYIHNVLERELEVIGNIYENPELLEGN